MKLEQEDIIRQLTLIGYSEEQVEWFLKMRKLIPVEEDKTVNGRKLHEVLKVGRDYSTWIKQQFTSSSLVEGKHFSVSFKGDARFTQDEVENMSSQKRSAYGITTDYILTLNAAKHICMVTGTAPKTNEETKKISQDVRDYFIMTEEVSFLSLEYQIELEKRITANLIRQTRNAKQDKEKSWEVQGQRKDIIDEYVRLVRLLDYDLLSREAKAQLAKIDVLRELTGNQWLTK